MLKGKKAWKGLDACYFLIFSCFFFNSFPTFFNAFQQTCFSALRDCTFATSNNRGGYLRELGDKDNAQRLFIYYYSHSKKRKEQEHD